MSRDREMQVFEAVASAGSLAAAARQLQLSQATVTRTLAALEARLGSRLLTRGPRGVSLTEPGEAFAVNCRRILAGLAAAEQSVAGLHTAPAGHLTLALPMLMEHALLAPILLDYLAAFPGISLVTRACEGVPRLLEEGIDLALVVGPLADSSGFAVPVGWTQALVCAAPGYLQRHGVPVTPQALSGHRLIAFSTTGHSGDWRMLGGGVKVAPRLLCSTPQAAIAAARNGLGLARCMRHEVHAELRSGQLTVVLQAYAPAPLPVQLIYREGRRAAGRVRSFLDFVVPRLRAHPALIG